MSDYTTLCKLGFSTNEAKCYIALHKKSPLTGYQVANEAGITRTMVYDILRRLARKGYIEVIEGNPRLYSAVAYKRLVSSIRNDYERRLEELEETLEKISREVVDNEYVLNISGRTEVISLIRKAIIEAKREIYLSIWDSEARLFEDDLKKADDSGVKIYIFSFCKLPFDFGIQYTYGMKDAKENFPRRRIVAVFDRELALMGEGNEEINEIGITTRNQMIMQLAIDQILLDIILLHTLRSGGYINKEIQIDDYHKSIDDFFKSISLPKDLPLRIDE